MSVAIENDQPRHKADINIVKNDVMRSMVVNQILHCSGISH